MPDGGYGVNSEFDLEKHKATFINYLEVIVDVGGTVMYAVPSHQEKLIAIACRDLGVSRRELLDMVPQEYYFDFLNWLCMKTGCMAVWNARVFPEQGTRKQVAAIRKLKMAGVYKGTVPIILRNGGEYRT